MIKTLDSYYEDAIIKFLKEDSYKNLYLLANIEFHGFNAPYLKIWGEFNNDSKLIAILIKINNFFLCSANSNFSYEKFANIISSSTYTTLCGETSTLEKIKPFIDFIFIETSTLSVIDNTKKLITSRKNLQEIQFGHGNKIAELSNLIDDFPNIPYTANKLDLDILTQRVKGYCLFDNIGNIICMAQLLLDTDDYGIIVSVATHPNFRCRGYASMCVSQLIKTYISKGKSFALTYTNKQAGNIYHSLGFKDVCSWSFISN